MLHNQSCRRPWPPEAFVLRVRSGCVREWSEPGTGHITPQQRMTCILARPIGKQNPEKVRLAPLASEDGQSFSLLLAVTLSMKSAMVSKYPSSSTLELWSPPARGIQTFICAVDNS